MVTGIVILQEHALRINVVLRPRSRRARIGEKSGRGTLGDRRGRIAPLGGGPIVNGIYTEGSACRVYIKYNTPETQTTAVPHKLPRCTTAQYVILDPGTHRNKARTLHVSIIPRAVLVKKIKTVI